MNNSLNQSFGVYQQSDPLYTGYGQMFQRFGSEHTSRTFPDHTDSGSYQSAQTFHENHEKIQPTAIDKTFYSEIRSRHGLDKPMGQQIPITIQSGTRNRNVSENLSFTNARNVTTTQSVRETTPVQRVENLNGFQLNNDHDLVGEEKTVTIKRKITKRKKANENVNTLRDSYIDKINLTTQPYETYSSDTDDNQTTRSRLNQEIKEPILPLKTVPKYEQPKPHEEVKEEFIIPKVSERSPQQIPDGWTTISVPPMKLNGRDNVLAS